VLLPLAANLPLVSLTPVAKLPPVSTINTSGTGGKICHRFVDTGKYFREFSKFEMILMLERKKERMYIYPLHTE
jgi:hypothetical protein